MKTAISVLPILLFLVMIVAGCNSASLSDIDLPIPEGDTESESIDSETSTIAASTSGDASSPAVSTMELPSRGASPVEVCQHFVECLNREESDCFELLLTPAALGISTRTQFRLPPVASAAANIELDTPKYGTNREKLCYVDCKLEEPDGQSDSERPEKMTWMLRKTKAGWRVAGMLIASSETQDVNLLSFENEADIEQIRSSLMN